MGKINVFNNINTIPVLTWKWLKVNNTSLENKDVSITKYNLKQNIINQEGVFIEEISEADSHLLDFSVKINADDNLREFSKTSYNNGYFIQIEENKIIDQPIIFDYTLDAKNPTLISNDFILLKKNSIATVIFRYKSENDLKAFNASFTRVHLEDNARLNLFKIQMLGENSVNVDFIGSNCESGSIFNPVILDLGSLETIGSCDVSLVGENSSCNLESAYLGRKEEKLDYNYRVSFHGKKSFGEITTNGVLMDRAKKVYRGTIDFYPGSTGSVGSEEEHTVLLSKDVKNVSVPLLLCGEHDVEGNHATSTGQLDTEALFYLMSRGLSEKQAKKMIVEATFTPILEKISDEDIKNQAIKFVRGHLEHA